MSASVWKKKKMSFLISDILLDDRAKRELSKVKRDG